MLSVKQLGESLDTLRDYQRFDRPILILAAPRSGSSFLYDLLCQFDETWGWEAEMDGVWWNYFPYDRLHEPSDLITAEEYSSQVARKLRREFYRFARWGREQRGKEIELAAKLGLRSIRYVDKTIANCFHLELLHKLFPEARYVLLLRDARATISSMMEGWQDPVKFVKPQLQPIVDRSNGRLSHWSYPAPPGWSQQLDRPLEEVCAWSWSQHIGFARSGLAAVPAHRQQVIRYEDLVQKPVETMRKLASFCQLAWSSKIDDHLARPPLSRTTISAPRQDKWKILHGEAIERVLPTIRPLVTQLGYDFDE